MATTLTGSSEPVELDPGYQIRTPGWKGTASIQSGDGLTTRAATAAIDEGMEALDAALALTDTTTVRQIELQLEQVPSDAGAGTGRSAEMEDAVELEVPDLGPGVGQLLMSIDDAGVVRWHLPASTPDAGGATRGAGGGVLFRIPTPILAPNPEDGSQPARSILGAVGRRLLKVLVYPVSDPVVGKATKVLAELWESAKRPHRLRHFTPSDYGTAGGRQLSPAEFEQMAKAGPILLFIHGTFSTAHGGFGGIPQETMQHLYDRYGGRVIAFDHPTLSVDPYVNVRWLLQQFPSGPVEVDIVCHSRGGLVSRVLAESPTAAGIDASKVTVRKLVLGATPNQGTLLADPEHMVAMIDRLTTALTLLPGGPVGDTLEALVTAVKTIGHGGLKGLDGLRAMCPTGEFIGQLNAPGSQPASYFAIAANYEPIDTGLRALVTGGANIVVDKVFNDADNDLVVPTEGVYETNGNARFPVPSANRLVLGPTDGAMHTTVFQHPAVSRQLLAWL